jgi:UDP-GlcNAc:undecaprenyl-phosphate/decaprenyl-phosphate GlcNAc-1-phosphate transferase
VIFVVSAVSLLAVLALTPIVVRLAHALGVVGPPGHGRHIHTKAIPRLGGVAVLPAALIGLVAALGFGDASGLPGSHLLWAVAAGSTLLFAVGLVDDLRGVRPFLKVFAQVGAGLLIYAFGFRLDSIAIGPSLSWDLGVLSLPATLLWIVAVTNAINLIDGLDGLAAGLALIALLGALLAAGLLGNAVVLPVALALAGALIGFLRYNFFPARIFLGDSGSLVIGFMVSVIVAGAARTGGSGFSIPLAFGLLAIPLFDTALCVVRRWLRGTSIASGDARHIHHQLLRLGLTHRNSVLVLYGCAAVFATIGLVITLSPPIAIASVTLSAAAAFTLLLAFFTLRLLNYHEFEEALQVLLHAPTRLRRVIRDHIHARDVATAIAPFDSVLDVNDLLLASAATFGFYRMELLAASQLGTEGALENAGKMWRVEYPIATGAGDDPYLLRITCDITLGHRYLGAERVARTLAPSLELSIRRCRVPTNVQIDPQLLKVSVVAHHASAEGPTSFAPRRLNEARARFHAFPPRTPSP